MLQLPARLLKISASAISSYSKEEKCKIPTALMWSVFVFFVCFCAEMIRGLILSLLYADKYNYMYAIHGQIIVRVDILFDR